MPAARGVKRAASKSSASTASTGPKNKKKRNVVQLEVPTLPKRRGRVLTCGQGDVGQLGLGEDVIETTRFKHVTGLGEKIVDACAGGMHTIAIDSDGKVWTFGCNDEGALGRAVSGDAEGAPGPVALPLPAAAISAGDSHSAALLSNGHVYAWGSFRDSHGSMGLVVRGREGKPCREPVRVDVPERAAAIASGSDHLVVLTTSGAVYTMGCGEQGQLGRLAQRSASRDTRQGFSALLVPSKVTLKQGASRVWAGYHATVVLDGSAEKVFAWGLNNYGQLGITGEKRKTALFSPTEADAFTACGGGWRGVACGQHHSLALDGAGRVRAVGRVEYGRLGLGERSGDAEALELVPKLQNKNVVSIAAGTSNSFAVTDAGEIYAWGMGSEGQLGTGGSSDATEPTLAAASALRDRAPVHVSAGGQHTVLLVEDPNAKKDASPAPENESEEQKTEDMEEEEEPEPVPEKKPKGRANKRQKKQEQEEEVSSTSSAVPSDVTEDSAPRVTLSAAQLSEQKVNGDETKETSMEVDETDSKQDKPEETKETEEHKTTNTTTKEDSKPETTDTSSQDTVESETSAASQDVDMKEPEAEKTEAEKPEVEKIDAEKIEAKKTEAEKTETETKKAELNGAPEESNVEVEAKSVDSIQADQAVVSSA